jgi:hypothetical protein
MSQHPRPWHRGSVFGDGPRHPLDRERRAQWKARLAMHERAGRITATHEKVGLALLHRLGQDGRLDPSHATLASDTGRAPSTVKRALARLKQCGLVAWVLRIVRDGNRVVQTSNGYLVTLGSAPVFPESRCKARTDLGTLKLDISTAQTTLPMVVAEGDRQDAKTALAKIAANRQAAVLAALTQKRLTRGAVVRT